MPQQEQTWDELVGRKPSPAQPPPSRVSPPPTAGTFRSAPAKEESWDELVGRKPSSGSTMAAPSSASSGFTPMASQPKQGFIGKAVDFANTPGLGTGLNVSGLYDKLMNAFDDILPEEYRGSYIGTALKEVARVVPEGADFFTSPAGALLLGSHFVPMLAPLAVIGDLVLGGYQGVRAIGSTISAVRDYKDPLKVADAAKDILMAVGVAKGFRQSMGAPEFKLRPDRPLSARRIIKLLSESTPEEKLRYVDELYAPLSKRQEKIAKVYNSPLTSTIASVLDIPKPKLMEAASQIVEDRNIAINLGKLEVGKLVYDGKREVPVADQDVRKMGYALEGDQEAFNALSPEGKKWIGTIRDWNRKVANMLNVAYDGKAHLRDPESYLMHRWGFESEGEVAKQWGSGVGKRILRDPQLRQRVIETYKQGIEEGVMIDGRMVKLKPAIENVFDLIQKRHHLAIQAVENRRVVHIMEGMGLLVDDTQATAGQDNPRFEWPQLDSEVVKKPAFMRSNKGLPVMGERKVRVHPDVKRPLEALFGDPFKLRDPGSGKMTAAGALEYLRAFGKQQAVSLTMFHNFSITEQAQAIQIGTKGVKGIPGAAKAAFFLNPEWYSGLKSGLFEVLGKPSRSNAPPVLGKNYEGFRDWVQHGMSVESPDAEKTVVGAMQEWKSKHGFLDKTLGVGIRRLGDAHYILNRSLWDYYLPSMQMFSADTILTKELARNPGIAESPERLAALKTEIAKHTNKAFGTENMSSMGMSPKVKTLWNWVLFAPTWTFSNLRVLTNGLQTETGRRLTGRYMGGAAFSWYITANLVNYATTSWYIRQGAKVPDRNGINQAHFMWDNPGAPVKLGGKWNQDASENSIYPFLGFNENGTEQYARFAKNFIEPITAIHDPFHYIANKFSLPLRDTFVFFSDAEPGSGFQVVDPMASDSKQWVQRGLAQTELVLPFAFQDLVNWAERKAFPEIIPERGTTQTYVPGTHLPLGVPAVQGFSATRAIKAYSEIMDDTGIDEKLRGQLIQRVMDVAGYNHIAPKTILNGYRQRKGKEKRIAQGPRTVYDKLGKAQSPPPSR